MPERSAQVLDERIPEIVCGEQLDHVGPDLPGVSHLGGRHGAGDGHHAEALRLGHDRVVRVRADDVCGAGIVRRADLLGCQHGTRSNPDPAVEGLDEGGDPSRVFTHGVGRRVVERALQQRDARFGAGERGLNQDLRPNAAPDDHQPIPLDQG